MTSLTLTLSQRERGFISLILCFTACLCLAACDSQQSREQRYLAHGQALFDKGDFEKARLDYKNAARIAPVDPQVSYRLGLVDEAELNIGGAYGDFLRAEEQNNRFQPALLKLAAYDLAGGQPDQAQHRVDVVLADTPDQPEARALHAALLLRQKDYSACENEARFALTKDPANVTAFSVLTGLYLTQNDRAKAGATIDEAVAKNPANVSLRLLQVEVYRQAGDYARIDAAYQAIFAQRPKDAQFRVDLAGLYIAAGKLDQAEATLRAATAALPDDMKLKHMLAVFLGDHRSVDAAEQEIHGYMKTYPDNDDLYVWLADIYATHDAVDQAVALLQQIVTRDDSPKQGLNARTTLARIDFVRGNTELAEKLITTVLATSPGNRDALIIRANIAFDRGNYEAAVADLRTILADRPHDGEALQLLAETLLRQGYANLASQTMEQLVAADPGNLGARVRLAQIYGLEKDTSRALATLDAVTIVDPGYSVAWETIARITLETGDLPRAQDAINKLATLPGQAMTATFLQGQLVAKQGDSQKAIGLYTKVIDADPASPLAEHSLSALVDTGKTGDVSGYIGGLKTKTPYAETVLGELYAKQGKMAEAKTAFDNAIAAKPGIQQPYLDRAKLFVADHQPDQALDLLVKADAAVPADKRAAMMQGTVLDDAGQHQKAIDIYAGILTRDPGFDLAANNMAAMIADYAYTDKAQLDKAAKAAAKFSTASHPELLDTLAWVSYRQGDTTAALNEMQRAASLGALSPQMHYHYGAILQQAGRHDEALAELRQAVTTDAKYPGLEEAKAMVGQ